MKTLLTKLSSSRVPLGLSVLSAVAILGVATSPAQAGLYPTDHGDQFFTPNDFIQSVPVCNVGSGCDVIGDDIVRFGASLFADEEYFIGLFGHTVSNYVTVWEYGQPPDGTEHFNVQLGNWDGTNFNQLGNSIQTDLSPVFGTNVPEACGSTESFLCNSATIFLSSLGVADNTANAIRISGVQGNHADIAAAAAPTVPEPSALLGLLGISSLGLTSKLKKWV